MSYTVTLEIPEETLQQYQRGASAARKKLETFIVDRLVKSPPPITAGLEPSRNDLSLLEALDDGELLQIAQSTLPSKQQKLYDGLLERNNCGLLNTSELETLHAIGDEARRLMLKKSHAYMLLQWRGVQVPKLSDLENIVSSQ